ncbi:MAG: GPW/gp25 family protein [Lachnospiraceae bacterium]|nr:GPW/gp25 family protein [Lachnospiraceae bacterium]MBQ5534216.1 GPW/gp25 family protein [Lachnospiraceae bacterium]
MADRRFLGTGMKFPPQIDPATGRFMTVSGAKNVKESLYLILMTQVTERLVRPDFGSDIMSYTFMDTGSTMMSIFRRNITETIMSQEPRISEVNVDMEYVENRGAIIVNIEYLVSATNTRDNLVFPFYLDKGGALDEEEPVEPEDYYDPDEDTSMMMEEV